MTAKITAEQKVKFVAALREKFGPRPSRQNIVDFAEAQSIANPIWLLYSDAKVGRGEYNLDRFGKVECDVSAPVSNRVEQAPPVLSPMNVVPLQQKKLQTQVENAVPVVDKDYVPFGYHKDLTTIIESRIFYPTFISGLSGNGKTMMVEQICAKLGREVYRVNISVETDEDSLVGGHTLIDGNIVYREGPALIAMRRGAILLLDEVDRGDNKLICLQAILEGKPYFNKKTGEVVHPKEGFNVIATANTKGQGSDDGKFSAAKILDEAFLERFAIAIEQQYPEPAQEKRILQNNMKRLNCEDDEFRDNLIKWAEIIRDTYAAGGIDDVITTRRLVHIVQAYAMFKDRKKALALCVARFDAETRNAFLELYEKLEVPAEEVPANEGSLETPKAPF